MRASATKAMRRSNLVTRGLPTERRTRTSWCTVDRFKNNAYDLVIDGESYRPRLKPVVDNEPRPAAPVVERARRSHNEGPWRPCIGFEGCDARSPSSRQWPCCRTPDPSPQFKASRGESNLTHPLNSRPLEGSRT
jgi:hypothetical protein